MLGEFVLTGRGRLIDKGVNEGAVGTDGTLVLVLGSLLVRIDSSIARSNSGSNSSNSLECGGTSICPDKRGIKYSVFFENCHTQFFLKTVIRQFFENFLSSTR